MIGLTVIGCGSREAARPPAPTPPPVEAEKRSAQTEKVEMVARDESRMRAWSVQAKSAKLNFAGEGKMSGDLVGVSGVLFKNDTEAGTFTADRGSANQEQRRLVLRGRVRLVSLTQKAVLTADELEWLDGEERVEARGNVRVRSERYEVGPFPKVLATPDLTDIGTPDMFMEKRR